MSDGGKGSAPRPFSVTQEEFANNWNKIFGNKNEKATETNQVDQSVKSGELAVQGLQSNPEH